MNPKLPEGEVVFNLARLLLDYAERDEAPEDLPEVRAEMSRPKARSEALTVLPSSAGSLPGVTEEH